MRLVKNVFKFLLFFSVGAFILYLLYQNQSQAYAEQCLLDDVPPDSCNYMDKLKADFRNVKWPWLILVLTMYMASNFSRALRWSMMFRPMGYTIRTINAFGSIMFMYFANLGLPRFGEILRPIIVSRYEKIAIERVLGTIVAERALDFIMLFMVIGLALFLEYDVLWGFIQSNQTLSEKLTGILTHPLFYISLIVGFFTAWLFLRSDYFKRTKIGKSLFGLMSGLVEGIRSILRLERPLLFIGHTLFIWFMYYMMTRICFYSFEPTSHLGAVAGLLVFVFGSLGIIFPSPGGMGSYHALIMAGLALYGVSQSDGFSYANIIFFSIQIFCNIIFGLAAYLLLPLYNKGYSGAAKKQNNIIP